MLQIPLPTSSSPFSQGNETPPPHVLPDPRHPVIVEIAIHCPTEAGPGSPGAEPMTGRH